jgi:hypothetical protein
MKGKDRAPPTTAMAPPRPVGTFNGLSPKVSELHGPPLAVDTGSITFLITVDTATGEFISAEILSIKGPRPVTDCDVFVAALT